MRNIFLCNLSFPYQCYLDSLAFSDFAPWFIIHRGQRSWSLLFNQLGFFSLNTYQRVWFLGVVWIGGSDLGFISHHQCGNTLEVQALGTDLPWSACWEMGTGGNRVPCPSLSGSISFVRIQARSTGESVGRVGWWQWQPWGPRWGGLLKERHAISQGVRPESPWHAGF